MTTELELQKRLYYRWGAGRELAIANIFAFGGNESDFLTLTKNGYTDEYEIKVTRADFKADRLKLRHEKYTTLSPWAWSTGFVSPRHGSRERAEFYFIRPAGLAKQYPNRFWYVTPKGLIEVDELPTYAGLIEYEPEQRALHVTAKAPMLHKERDAERLRAVILKAAYYYRYSDRWGRAENG